MDELAKLLYFPLVVGVLGGLFVWAFQLWRKRQAMIAALELEIGLILSDARGNLEFMRLTPHYWLTPGVKVVRAPTALSPPTVVFSALLSEIYVIGKGNVRRVLTFYTQHRLCEELRASLFANLAVLRDAGKVLTVGDVAVLEARLGRLCSAYDYLERENPDETSVRMGDVRNTYEVPSADEVNSAIRELAATEGE